MKRNGIRHVCGIGVLLMVWLMPVHADDTAEEITAMMAWWDEYGSYWDEASELLEFAGDIPVYVLAENTLAVEVPE